MLKAESYVQFVLEHIMKFWGNVFSTASRLGGRLLEIAPEDIELTLSVQGQLTYLNKKEVTHHNL
jgi:hypothetical protein